MNTDKERIVTLLTALETALDIAAKAHNQVKLMGALLACIRSCARMKVDRTR